MFHAFYVVLPLNVLYITHVQKRTTEYTFVLSEFFFLIYSYADVIYIKVNNRGMLFHEKTPKTLPFNVSTISETSTILFFLKSTKKQAFITAPTALLCVAV